MQISMIDKDTGAIRIFIYGVLSMKFVSVEQQYAHIMLI